MTTTTFAPETEATREEILDHLRQILSDRRFASAERNANFLRYVIEATLDGRAHEVKETVIATEVYGRASSYDPKADSIVRVEASRLRQKLRSYYEAEGQSTSIRINLPSGSYVPRFTRVGGIAATPASSTEPLRQPASDPEPTPVSDQSSTAWLRPELLGLATSFALLVVLFSFPKVAPSAIPNVNEEAAAAWREGVELLNQDPHAGSSERGAPKTLVRAIERLEFAVARSPEFARGWATLAEAYDYAFAFVGRDSAEDARREEAAARKAIALDDKLASGHHMLALVLGSIKWDFAQSEAAYARALALDPRNAYAAIEYTDLLRETGRIDRAVEEIRRARALLPALPQLAVKEAELHVDLGRPELALATADAAIELNQNYLRAHIVAAAAYEAMGDYQQALGRYERVLPANPLDRRALPAYGYLLAKMGKTDQAREVLAKLEKMNATLRNCAFQVAVVHVGLGDERSALDWLERAWRTRQAHFPFAAVEPRFRTLHENPRFQELLARVGLKPVTIRSVT
jgi:tetratricopeptide (TPR) repeat protein